jgi:Protein of unknown function (DUF3999)
MTRLALCALAMLGAANAAAQDVGTMRHRAAILGPAGHSHYRVLLPAAVYAGAARRDLGDLRVFNARGESVPYAFLPREPANPPPVLIANAKLFPVYGPEAQGIDGVKLDVVRGETGTVIRLAEGARTPRKGRKLLGYLVEVGKNERPIEAVVFTWRTAHGFNGKAKIEGSDDLSRWYTLVHDAPILALEHAGQRLERRRVELRGRKAQYLRISFAHMPEDFELRGVRLERQGERAEPGREWRRLAAVESSKSGEYRFDAGGRFPVDRVRFHLPQQNTVARVQLFTRDRDEQPWRALAGATVYRLQRDGSTVTSSDVRVPESADRQWLVRADPRGGGLGAGGVALELGWIPHEMVFAARGEAPFILVFGDSRARPEALPVASVVPGYKKDADLVAPRATLGELILARPPKSLLSDPAGWVRAALDSGDAKTWLLWFVLGAGVLAVAWMALRLLRDLGGKAPPPPRT